MNNPAPLFGKQEQPRRLFPLKEIFKSKGPVQTIETTQVVSFNLPNIGENIASTFGKGNKGTCLQQKERTKEPPSPHTLKKHFKAIQANCFASLEVAEQIQRTRNSFSGALQPKKPLWFSADDLDEDELMTNNQCHKKRPSSAKLANESSITPKTFNLEDPHVFEGNGTCQFFGFSQNCDSFEEEAGLKSLSFLVSLQGIVNDTRAVRTAKKLLPTERRDAKEQALQVSIVGKKSIMSILQKLLKKFPSESKYSPDFLHGIVNHLDNIDGGCAGPIKLWAVSLFLKQKIANLKTVMGITMKEKKKKT